MLRLSITALLLVGATLAQSSNGLKDGKEYIYKIKSRTLASFNENAKQFSGIVMEGQLAIQASGAETLRAKISRAQYSSINTQLDDGWDSDIPNDKITFQNFPISDKAFEIKMKRGVVKDLVVDKNLPTWQVNVLKSIVGQLQVDTLGENAEKSEHQQFPEGKQPYATFQTMEDSVGGKCKVVYDVSPLPNSMLQNKPELAPMPELREDGEIISVVKSKNYSNCAQRVSYHFGINGRNNWEPGSNENGKYLSRSSVSHIVISGDVKKFIVQSSDTSSKVVFNPNLGEDQQGAIASKVELRLHKVGDVQEKIPAPSDPKSAGNLVYDFNDPFDKESSPRHSSHSKSHQKNKKNKEHWRDNDGSYEINSSATSSEEVNDDTQPEPTMTQPPHNPMLPFFIGNNGHSITEKIDLVKSTKSIAQEIGSEMVHYDVMPEEDSLEKFTILSRLVRLMNANEVDEVQRELYEPPRPINEPGPGSEEKKARRNSWVAFRDAVAQAGTGPALVNVKKWIQEEKIKDDEAATVINSIAKSTRTPTPEYMETFLEMLKLKQVIDPPVVYDNAHQSYADLVRHAIVNRKSAHNRYPVYAFGKFYGKNIHNLHSKYFPYMAAELQEGFSRKDSIKIQVIISAIGRTGHPRMLSLFEPYIEGKKEATPYQRFFMVLSMDRLATDYPKTARSVLYKIYSNTADHYEIRTAAVYLLMKTKPPTSMLQRMAEFTNYDNSKQVNSAVKSSIESLAQLHSDENQDLADAARTALPLLTKEVYGPQYSRAFIVKGKDSTSNSESTLEAYYIGSDDSIIPKGISITVSPVQDELKMPKVQMAGAVSKIRDLFDSLQKQLGLKDKNNEKAKQKKYSPENIAKALGIDAEKAQLLEGFISVRDATESVFFSYSEGQTAHTGEYLDNLLSDLPEKLRRLQKNLAKGVNFDETSMLNSEVTMSFPTETGYPLTFNLKIPTISKVIGHAHAQIEADQETHSPLPKSATLTAKVHFIHGMKIQKRLSFVTPFEHQQYIAGVDKSVQLHLPVKAEIEYSKDKREASLKIQPNNEEPQFKIVQTKIEPFTSKHDVFSLKPVSTDKNTRVIHKENSPPLQVLSKDNQHSLLFNWERPENMLVTTEKSALKEAIGADSIGGMARTVASMFVAAPQEDTEYQKYWVKLSPENNLSIEMKVAYDSLVKDSNNQDSSNDENEKPKGRAPRLDSNMNAVERRQTLLREASSNINSAEAIALDISFKLNGELETFAKLTVASAKSYVDEKSRTLVYATGKVPISDEFFFAAGFESKSPNFRTMDYEETLKANTQHELDGEFKFGKKMYEDAAETFYLNGKVKQTEGRKNEIRQSRQAQECTAEAKRSGNKLTPVCQRVNELATMINAGDFTFVFEEGSPIPMLSTSALDKALYWSPASVRRNGHGKGENNKIKFSFEVSPNEETVDFKVITPDGEISVPNVKMPRKDYDEIQSVKENESWENAFSPFGTCALDKTQIKTFDNHRYNTQLGQCWHVAMTPFPKKDYFKQGQEKEIPEDEHLTVMTRDNNDGHKEFMVTLGDKEIELFSRDMRRIEVKVNGENIKLSKKHSYQENKNKEIIVEIFELPDKSVKLLSEKYQVEITYDGSRAIIKAGDKYRGSVRGLCGDYDGEPENDQKTPKDCLLESPEEFSATYAFVNDHQCSGPARENAEKAKQAECIKEDARPGNVISDKEAGRKQRTSSSSEETDSSNEDENCTKRRTMVSRSGSEICFSVKPVPSCASGCHSTGKKNKDIAFHCVRRSRISERIAERIEKGANPDLSQKKVSRTENHMIPISCRA